LTARLISQRPVSKRAKTLKPKQIDMLLQHVSAKRHAERNCVMVLLAFKAGLRACEISGLDWSMVTDAQGAMADTLDVGRHIAKMGAARSIPCNDQLARALKQLHHMQGLPTTGPVCRSQRGDALCAKAVVNWFAELFAELDLNGCSSHSGRRTFITQGARLIFQTGGSLRDIQLLAGHRSIKTTQDYIGENPDAQRRLVGLL
jgi:integrase